MFLPAEFFLLDEKVVEDRKNLCQITILAQDSKAQPAVYLCVGLSCVAFDSVP